MPMKKLIPIFGFAHKKMYVLQSPTMCKVSACRRKRKIGMDDVREKKS
jgi:hypothetical protein